MNTFIDKQGVGSKLMNNVIDAAIADQFVTKVVLNVHVNDINPIK